MFHINFWVFLRRFFFSMFTFFSCLQCTPLSCQKRKGFFCIAFGTKGISIFEHLKVDINSRIDCGFERKREGNIWSGLRRNRSDKHFIFFFAHNSIRLLIFFTTIRYSAKRRVSEAIILRLGLYNGHYCIVYYNKENANLLWSHDLIYARISFKSRLCAIALLLSDDGGGGGRRRLQEGEMNKKIK